MRNQEGSSQEVPKPFELACQVGWTVTCFEDELDKLEPGEYDVLSEYTSIKITGEKVVNRVQLRLRRIA